MRGRLEVYLLQDLETKGMGILAPAVEFVEMAFLS